MSSKRMQENNELRRAQVKAFEDSDMSAKEWCEENLMSGQENRPPVHPLRQTRCDR